MTRHVGDRCGAGPVVAVQEIAKRFPHINTGEEFTGYQKTG